MCGEIENLEGVEKVGRIYNKNLLKAITNEEKKLLIENIDELGMETGYDGNLAYGYMVITEKNQVDLNLYGMSDVLFPLLKPYVIEGDIDLDLFRTGDYIISTRKHNNIDIYKVGDKVTLSSDDGHSKEYSVMAVVENLPLYLYIGRDSDFSLSMYMPSEELEKIAGKLPIMVGMFDVEEDNISSVDAYIKDKTKEIPGLDYRSKETFVKEFNDMVNTYNTVGYSLSLIIGLIGVLNFANVIITSIISRRKEFATMQSIGLTSKQLKRMLFLEGFYYALMTIGVVILFGIPISYIGVIAYADVLSFFTYKFRILPILICLPIITGIAFIIPRLAYGNIKNDSIVERLREAE